MNENNRSKIYIIVVQGRLKDQWADWLNSAAIHIENCEDPPIRTVITVHVPDQAALRGILNKIWDLNLTLIAVNLQNLQAEQIAQGENHEIEL